MLRRLFTALATPGFVLASCCQMSGCIIVVDADDELDCVSAHLSDDDGTPRIGIEIDGVDAALAGQLNINAERATLVRNVHPGWPADRAGVHQFDVITKVDGSDDASPMAVQGAIRAKKPGETITLTVIRNAQPMDVTVTVQAESSPHDQDNDHDDE